VKAAEFIGKGTITMPIQVFVSSCCGFAVFRDATHCPICKKPCNVEPEYIAPSLRGTE